MADLWGWRKEGIRWAWYILMLPERKEVFKKKRKKGGVQKKERKMRTYQKELVWRGSTDQIWGYLSIEITKDSNKALKT